jgi:hypothetical protein
MAPRNLNAPTEIRVKGVPAKMKNLVYKESFRRGMSMSEFVKVLIRDHLYKAYPNDNPEGV